MGTARQSFKAILLQEKKTATGIQVPEAVVEKLGGGKRPPVKATINGYTYESTLGIMNGVAMLPVSAAVRDKAGVAAGDTVKVELELDSSTREVAIPADLKKALDKNAPAKSFFETLSNSNKKRYILPIEEAKTEETRTRRIEKTIAELTQQKKN